jgi:uncharacterized protein (DUF302 family)
MSESHFVAVHVRLATDKPFALVMEALEQQLGRFEPNELNSLAKEYSEEAKAKIEGMAGSSGFMLFGIIDQGALLQLGGQERKAVQFVVGNPLFALQMTKHDVRAGLYAPLRLLVYESDQGSTELEYDKPSSMFGQFNDERIQTVAAMLDGKMEELIAQAAGPNLTCETCMMKSEE